MVKTSYMSITVLLAIRVRSRSNRSHIWYFMPFVSGFLVASLWSDPIARWPGMYSPTIMPRAHNRPMQGQADTHTPSPSWWSALRLYKPSTAALVQRWRSASPPRTPSGQRYPSQLPWSCRRAPFLCPFIYPHQQLVTGAVLTQRFFMHAYSLAS